MFANGAAFAAFAALMSAAVNSKTNRPVPEGDGFTPSVCDGSGNNCRPMTQAEYDRHIKYAVADNSLTVTGDAAGQVFGVVFGVSVATGPAVDMINGDVCWVSTACAQFGLGVYAGVGGSLGGGVSVESLGTNSVSESWGIFGNAGAFGASAGGSINFSGTGAGGAKGFIGIGKGLSGGVQFCKSSLECMGQ